MARIAAVILKVGTFFRVAKTTTGCNMEGFGAGASACAAGFTELGAERPNRLKTQSYWPFLRQSRCRARRASWWPGFAPPISAAR